MHPLTKYIRETQSRQGPAGSSEARQISSMLGNEVHFLKAEHAIWWSSSGHSGSEQGLWASSRDSEPRSIYHYYLVPGASHSLLCKPRIVTAPTSWSAGINESTHRTTVSSTQEALNKWYRLLFLTFTNTESWVAYFRDSEAWHFLLLLLWNWPDLFPGNQSWSRKALKQRWPEQQGQVLRGCQETQA